MPFTGTVGALILFAGSTNSPPVNIGYFDGQSIVSINTDPSAPRYFIPYYIGKSSSDIPYIFANSDTGQTNVYSYSNENEQIESVGTITYPDRGRFFTNISSIKDNYVVICGGSIFYYRGGSFSTIPQLAQYDQTLAADILQTEANKLELLQDGKIYAFGRFKSADGQSYYSAVSSSDGISWKSVSNSQYNSTNFLQNFVSGTNVLDSSDQNTGKVLIVGCQQPVGSICNMSCNTSQPCANQTSRLLISPTGTPSNPSINKVWAISGSYIATMDIGSYHNVVKSSNGIDWEILYSSTSPINSRGISYTIVSNFVYSPDLVKVLVIGSSGGGNYSVLSTSDFTTTPTWNSVSIPRAFGTPGYIMSRPSPSVSGPDEEDKKEAKKLSAWENIWQNYKIAIIFGGVAFIFILLRIYVSFVKSLQSQQAAIAALVKSSTPPK